MSVMPVVDPASEQIHALYSDHHGWLLAWLRRKLGCAHSAQDIAQETFMRILRGLRAETLALPGLMEPRAFLVTTATRLLIDDARRRTIERSYCQSLALQLDGEACVLSAEELHEIVETLSLIARMLDGLAEKPRAAFLMYRFDELPQAEIARRLGVSVSMIKQYVAQVMVHCYAIRHGLPA
jgi:RNA polymerase sigma-70 factor (ECF subfamily)